MTTIKLAEFASGRGVDLLDAPVTAVPARLEAGEGRFLLGGSEASVRRAREQLLLVGKSADRFGPLGAGNIAKIAKALINASERVALNEVLQLASAGGLDIRQFLEFEREAPSERGITRWNRIFEISDNRATPRPATNLFRKDIFLAAKLADAYGLEAPLTHASAETARRWLQIWDDVGADET
jgi:3-hydroxyisobutyrate dehydrogenase-like beta-hydroxyacid dehydrogenase